MKPRRVAAVTTIALLISTILCVGFLVTLNNRFVDQGSRMANALTGQTYKYTNHTAVVYVTAREFHEIEIVAVGAALCFAFAVAVAMIFDPFNRRKRG
jgi:hypothetical protein